MKEFKICPICKEKKEVEGSFYRYFSKSRNKYRVSNYCKPCSREKGKPRASKHYWDNHEQKLEYHKEYRKNNKEKI